jgi:hypothetical protein
MTDTIPPTIDMDLQVPATMTLDGEPRIVWRNRTKMAWVCMALIVSIVGAACLLPVERLAAAKDVLTSALYSSVMIIAAYFGTTALPFITGRK